MTDAASGADENHGDLRDLGELHGVVHRPGRHRYRRHTTFRRRHGNSRYHIGIARYGWSIAVDAQGDRQIASPRYLIDQRFVPGKEKLALRRVRRSRIDREGDLTWDNGSLVGGNDDPPDSRHAGAAHAVRG